MKTKVRTCSCGKPRLKSWHLACPSCWAIIPPSLQEKVYHLCKTENGSIAHREAIMECYRIIHEARFRLGTLNQEIKGKYSTWEAGERVKVREVNGIIRIERVTWKGSLVPVMNQLTNVPADFIDLDAPQPKGGAA